MFESSNRLFSPELAKELLEKNYIKNRPIRPSQVNYLASEMKAGRFSPAGNICVAMLNGSMALINGQHTLTAIVKSGIPQTLTFQRHFMNTEEEVQELYSRYDINIKKTLQNTIVMMGMDKQLGLKVKDVMNISGGVQYLLQQWESGKRKNKTSFEDMAKLCRVWEPQYTNYLSNVPQGDAVVSKRVSNKQVMAVVLLTFKYQPEKALDFWTGVLTDKDQAHDDPRKTLHRYLWKTSTSRTKNNSHANVVSKYDMFCAVVKCWNKWYDGLPLKQIRTLNKAAEKKALLIKGTPWDGTYESIS